MNISDFYRDKFLKEITKIDNDCWEWAINSGSGGYGSVYLGKIGGKELRESAHRLSWIIHKGEIPCDLLVLHKCNNCKCVNPEHLYLGTAKDNTRDRFKAGTVAFGFKASGAFLTTEDVFMIRKLWNDGIRNKAEIARRFKISEQHTCRIIAGTARIND